MSSPARTESAYQLARWRADRLFGEYQAMTRDPGATVDELFAAEQAYAGAVRAVQQAEEASRRRASSPHSSRRDTLNAVTTAEAEYRRAAARVERASARYDGVVERGGDPEAARLELDDAIADADRAEAELDRARTGGRARLSVAEPDLYTRERPTFLQDLYQAQLRGDPVATERISQHHRYEVEKRATASSTLGGIIPPQYLVDLYAKAPRNGRVFANELNRQPLPPEGMSLVVPRLTQGTTAAVQASENTAVSTQDPTEVDLTLPVRTVGGFLPVSRQTLERASYSEQILFEDLTARYDAALDTDILSGSGASGHVLGLLNTSGLSESVAGTQSMTSIWPKIGDVIQQINSVTGGLGYVADKIFMHPRRWGWMEAQLDSSGRPIFGINGLPNYAPTAEGAASGYGYVGRLHGLPVFIDANVPSNFHTDEDVIIVCASQIVHLWENEDGRPVTVAFEQQAGTSLQVQLVAYGYLAFTAGRYPAATGIVDGAGLTTPDFGS